MADDECVVAEASTGSDKYKAILAKSEREHRLVLVHWELTYRCNERCSHCYLDVLAPGAKVPGELSTDECRRVIDELAALGGLSVSFSGGEALMRSDLFEIAAYARRQRFAVRLFTNGLAIKPEVADRIAALYPTVVEISVYGVDAATHESITTVPGSFDLTMRAFDLLQERGVRTLLKAVIMRENYRQMSGFRALAQSKGANFHYDLTVSPKHTGDRAPFKHRMTDDELLEFYRSEMDPLQWKPTPNKPSFRFCGIGLTSLTLGPYGDVYSCVGARVRAGNVREQSLAEIWKQKIWGELAALNLANLPACSKCELQPYCIRCHGNAGFEDGDMLGCSSSAYREARLRREALLSMGAPDVTAGARAIAEAEGAPAGA